MNLYPIWRGRGVEGEEVLEGGGLLELGLGAGPGSGVGLELGGIRVVLGM